MSLACAGAFLAACGFFQRVQIGIDVHRKAFIEIVRSYSINLHQFLSFELLQLLVEITSLVYINKINTKFRDSNRCKKFLKLSSFLMLVKQGGSNTLRNLDIVISGVVQVVFSANVNLLF